MTKTARRRIPHCRRIEVTGTNRARIQACEKDTRGWRKKMGEERKKKRRRDPGTRLRNPWDDNRFARPVPRPFVLLFFLQPAQRRRIHSLSSNPSPGRSIPCSSLPPLLVLESARKELILDNPTTSVPSVADNVIRFCSLTFFPEFRPFTEPPWFCLLS